MGKMFLEKNCRLKDSVVWKLMRDFYCNEGHKAWLPGKTPQLISSNPYTAYYYANVFIMYIKDLIAQKKINTKEPIYLLELGAGHGAFSFHCRKSLDSLCKKYNLTHLNFIYIMSDLSIKNVKTWKKHQQFLKWASEGKMDFSCIDLTLTFNEIPLEHSQLTISASNITNPLLIIANYIFDTLPDDRIYYKKDKFYLAQSTISINKKFFVNGKITHAKELNVELDFTELPCIESEQSSINNGILNHYKCLDDNTYFQHPTYVIQLLNTLQNISNDNLFLISSDRGPTQISDFTYSKKFNINRNDAVFWTDVNYHALKTFWENKNRTCYHLDPSKYFTTTCFISEPNINDFTLTKHFNENPLMLSPLQFWHLISGEIYSDNHSKFTKEIKLLKISRHLPELLAKHVDILIELAKQKKTYKSEILEELNNVVENLYIVPGRESKFYSAIGKLYYHLGEPDRALHYYELNGFTEKDQ